MYGLKDGSPVKQMRLKGLQVIQRKAGARKLDSQALEDEVLFIQELIKDVRCNRLKTLIDESQDELDVIRGDEAAMAWLLHDARKDLSKIRAQEDMVDQWEEARSEASPVSPDLNRRVRNRVRIFSTAQDHLRDARSIGRSSSPSSPPRSPPRSPFRSESATPASLERLAAYHQRFKELEELEAIQDRIESIGRTRSPITTRQRAQYYPSTDEEELQELRDKLAKAVTAAADGDKEALEAEEAAELEAEAIKGLEMDPSAQNKPRINSIVSTMLKVIKRKAGAKKMEAQALKDEVALLEDQIQDRKARHGRRERALRPGGVPGDTTNVDLEAKLAALEAENMRLKIAALEADNASLQGGRLE